jgi:hypothetical protein
MSGVYQTAVRIRERPDPAGHDDIRHGQAVREETVSRGTCREDIDISLKSERIIR